MPRGEEFPDAVRAQIVILKQRGDSWTFIGGLLGVRPDSARMAYNQWEETKCFASAPRSGRPKALDECDIRHIARHITSSRDTRRQALGDITNQLQLSVCSKTLRKTIIEDIGLKHRIEWKKSWLRPEQKAARLRFALDHIH